MRLLVCGDRKWVERQRIYDALVQYEPTTTTVITGGCSGVDSIAHQIGTELKMPTKVYPADWVQFGLQAGPIGNAQMLAEGKPDLILAFHSNLSESKGTANMILKAKRAKIPVVIFE